MNEFVKEESILAVDVRVGWAGTEIERKGKRGTDKVGRERDRAVGWVVGCVYVDGNEIPFFGL